MDVCFTPSAQYCTKGPNRAVRQENNNKDCHIRKGQVKLSYLQTTWLSMESTKTLTIGILKFKNHYHLIED